MPELGAGFGHAVMGTDLFGDEPATGAFTTKMEAEFNQPQLRLSINSVAYDDFIIDAPTVARGADIISGTINIVLSNTPKAQIHGVGIAFVDSDPDTITDSNSGFLTAGFSGGDKLTVSGSTSNDGTYIIASVTAGTITLVAGDSLTGEAAGDLVSILAQQAFNFFVNDRLANMGVPARLGLRFSGTIGVMYLMTGTVEEVSYNGATVTVTIRDKMAGMLERPIGSGQFPIDYYRKNTWGAIKTGAYNGNPATLVWAILTEWGGLDTTFSTDNIDIDFASWDAWRLRCVAHSYQVRARFPGTTVQNALLRIADMTNSFIWADGEGKFQFTMFEPPHTAGGSDETYDEDNSVNIGIDIDKSTVINTIDIFYGHDPDANYQPEATITSENIGFGDDNPDRIYITTDTGFLAAGFKAGESVIISGSEHNSGIFGIETVTDGALIMYEANGLSDEDEGASVTLTQNQDTSTYVTTSLVFNDTGANDTIYDVTGGFVVMGIDANDSITISGSTSNDGTYAVDSVTANTITLDVAETLTQEPSGATVRLTQIHSISYTATSIGFKDAETSQWWRWGYDTSIVDYITDSDFQLIDEGFKPQYDVTVSGSTSNDGTYRLGSVTEDEDEQRLNLQRQDVEGESPGPRITITQSHNLRTTGKQFESSVRLIDQESIDLYGIRQYTDEDKVIWFDTLGAVQAAGVAKLLIYKFPIELARIAATMVGFFTEPGDTIRVTEEQKEITRQVYFVKANDLDLEQGIANITGERGN